MFDHKIKLLMSIFIINHLSCFTISNPKFIGDKSFGRYLHDSCQAIHDGKNFHLNLIENFQFSNTTSWMEPKSLVREFLNQINCPFKHFTNINSKDLSIKLYNQTKLIGYYGFLCIFDLLHQSNDLNHNEFIELIMSLERVYVRCIDCYPLIILIHPKLLQQLIEWLIDSFRLFDQKFRCIFVVSDYILNDDYDKNHQKVIHVRPILDGCHIFNNVYYPRNENDFNRMKISYQKCNLNQTIIRVAVNDVSLKK